MNILHEVCSLPTAPFAEQRIMTYIMDFVAARRRLTLSRDHADNLLIELPADSSQPRWVFTAHMDHPGFVATRMLDDRTLEAAFRGHVLTEYVKGSKVVFFDGDREIRGLVTEAFAEKKALTPSRVRVQVKSRVSAGAIGMFDQGEGRIKNGKFYSRACDDVAGLAAALTMMDQLAKKPPKLSVAVLCTRAEEVGFIGAIAASLRPKLLRKTDRVIAIECSATQAYAPQGGGAIIRVGDRSSVFNSSLTYFLNHQAAELARKDKTFKYQRALMPGGTCEATVYDIYGFTASSICVPLGNYHNMDRTKKKIGPEYIDLNDWNNMVKLFVHLARTGHEYEPGHALLKHRVEQHYEKLKHLLRGAESRT